jgi:hypothetical protein
VYTTNVTDGDKYLTAVLSGMYCSFVAFSSSDCLKKFIKSEHHPYPWQIPRTLPHNK